MLKKSVIIANRHRTSVSLEKEFWLELKSIAQKSGLSINALITKIDAEREKENLSGAIRIFILKYLKSNQ